jgi:SM-20-related protein
MEIINKLDVDTLHQEYEETGAVIIKNLLCEDVAEAAYECLKNRVPWEFHYRKPHKGEVGIVRPQELQRMSERDIEKLVPKTVKLKDNDFTFAYCRYTIPTGLEQTPEELIILTRIYRYFNSAEYLKLLGDITGNYEGKEVSSWASCYDRHHHLSIHMDEDFGQGRIAAHVLGLTRDWKKEWGGNFAFCNSKGKAVDVVPPTFNQLVMFKVPRLHLVSPVKPYAQGSRYSLFGWYKTKKEYFTE